MGETKEEVARDLGRKLARELYDGALTLDQTEFRRRYGFSLPPEEIILGAASFLEYKARKIRGGENFGGSSGGSPELN